MFGMSVYELQGWISVWDCPWYVIYHFLSIVYCNMCNYIFSINLPDTQWLHIYFGPWRREHPKRVGPCIYIVDKSFQLPFLRLLFLMIALLMCCYFFYILYNKLILIHITLFLLPVASKAPHWGISRFLYYFRGVGNNLRSYIKDVSSILCSSHDRTQS